MSVKSAATLVVALPVASYLGGCSQQPLSAPTGTGGGSTGGTSTTTGVSVPTAPNGVYTFNFSDYPQLQNAGGSIRATINAASGAKDVYITHVAASSADTVSTICTHQGCVINSYSSATQQYDCPCHGSIFGADGSVVQGPATAPLPSYPTTVTGTGIQVTVM